MQPVTTATCGILAARREVPELKAADLQHDPIVAADLRQLVQQADADVAAQEAVRRSVQFIQQTAADVAARNVRLPAI